MSLVTHYRSTPTGYTACSKGGMSLRIKVGAFVGRYNLNSGIWEDDK